MHETRIDLHLRGECGGSVECVVTEKPEHTVWYELVVKVPGHPVWRIDLSRAVSMDNLVSVIIQYVDSRPGADRVHYPVTLSSAFPSGVADDPVRVASRAELDSALRQVFEPLVWK